VVNNGDHPNALDFAADIYPSAHIINSANVGFAAANNLALRKLDGYEWVALLNPDAFPEPDWLEQLMLGVRRNNFAQFFSSQLVQANNAELLDGQGDCYHVSGVAWRLNHGRKVGHDTCDREVFSPCAAAALYSRAALMDVGGFDEAYFCYFEDVDLGFRMRLRGYRCVHISLAVVRHVGGGATNKSELSDFALYYGHRNLVWTFIKNMPGYLIFLFLPLHLLLNLVELVWFSLLGKGRVIWRAKWHAWRKLPSILRQRKIIQNSRTLAPWTILGAMSFWPLKTNR